jgi:hypothetical protein
MPGGISFGHDVCNAQAIGVNTAATLGTAVTSNATADTKGAWTTLISATAADCALLSVTLQFDIATYVGNGITAAVDIGIGIMGSELVLIPNLVICQGWGSNGCEAMVQTAIPLQIPAGTRIAARCQDNSGGEIVNVMAVLYDAGFTQIEGAAGVDAIGFSAAATSGTLLATPSGLDTPGAFTTLITATARDYAGLFIAVDAGPVGSQSFFNDGQALIDLAIGSSGNEKIIVPSRYWTNPTQYVPGFFDASFVPVIVAAGQRLSARCQTSSSGPDTLALTAYGVYQ